MISSSPSWFCCFYSFWYKSYSALLSLLQQPLWVLQRPAWRVFVRLELSPKHQHWPGIGEEQENTSQRGGCSRGCARHGSLGLTGAALCVLLLDTSPSPCSWLTLDDHMLTRHRWPWVLLLPLTPQWESPGLEVLGILLSRIIPQTQGEDQSPHCRQLLLPHSQMFACSLRLFSRARLPFMHILRPDLIKSYSSHTQTLFLSLDPLCPSLPHTWSHLPHSLSQNQ